MYLYTQKPYIKIHRGQWLIYGNRTFGYCQAASHFFRARLTLGHEGVNMCHVTNGITLVLGGEICEHYGCQETYRLKVID